ncbi:3-ketoacyl-CoA synthase 11-like [Typha angustifolia]|uniref:3-ketoacyl-CoA synthase 11-like n=1 Tax=Typha angustifolia TaxID=59011 RepID=UPI003C30D0F9
MRTNTLLSPLTPIQLLQASFFFLLAFTLTLHALLSSTSTFLLSPKMASYVSQNRAAFVSLLFCSLVLLLLYIYNRRSREVLLLDYSCYLPDTDRKCSFEVSQYFVKRSRRFSKKSEEFMRGIYLKSGLGDETYAPPFLFQTDYEAKLKSAIQEAEEGMFSAVDALLSKANVAVSDIDVLIVTCGSFTSCPSLSSILINHYGFRETIASYNLTGMGCSSGAASIDLAGRILSSSRRIRYALVVITESISLNWYFGDNRSMLVTNCIFRVGTAAALLTNDPARRGGAKMVLTRALRTHCGADDAAHHAAYQEEDEEGQMGIALTKDLIRVAGEGLRTHIRSLAPKVLTWGQLAQHAWHEAAGWAKREGKPHVPDFTQTFEHVCVHTGGKAVIEAVSRILRFDESVTEPARMTLHRFGNTSSSLIFYELAYFEAKGRIKKGDKVWMMAFGTGFKACSLVWTSLKDSCLDSDNPWKDCIHRYPVKAW